MQVKRWATLFEPNFMRDLPELDQRSEIIEIVEAFRLVNLKVEKRRTELRNEKVRDMDNGLRQIQAENNMGYEKNTRKRLNAEGHSLGADSRQVESVMGNDETLRPNVAPEKAGDRRNSFTKEQTLQHGADTYERLAAIVIQRKGKGTNGENDKRRVDPVRKT